MQMTWRTFPRFYWTQFLAGFAVHLLLPVTLLLLLGLTTGRLGGPYGLFYLVWHENLVSQAVVGFAVLLLTWEVLFVGYLLQTRITPPQRRFEFPRGGPQTAYALGVVLCLLLTLLVVMCGLYLVRLLDRGEPDPGVLAPLPLPGWVAPGWGLPFAAGGIAAILLSFFISRISYFWPRLHGRLEGVGNFVFRQFERFPLLGVRRPDEQDLFLHGVAAVSVAFAALFFFVFMVDPAYFSPVVGICFLLHALVAAYAFLAYFLPRSLPVVLVLLLALLLLGGLPAYKQRFPGLEPLYEGENQTRLADYQRDAPSPYLLKAGDVAFCAKARGIHPADKKRPLVIVCASGGGIRSAAWTLAVLQRLETEFAKEEIRFPYHVRLVTGASGGMLGGAYYVATLPEPGQGRADGEFDDHYNRITKDALSRVVHRMAYVDLWAVLWPFPVHSDRGRALEESWGANLDGALNVTFEDLRGGEKEGWRPSLVFSPTLLEDGRRLLVSNLDLQGVLSNDGNRVGPGGGPFSVSGFEFFRLFSREAVRQRFQVGTAARMSATFPYVSPAVPLPTRPRRRVVDAGYYDNDGVSLAAAWLFSGTNRGWVRDHASGVVLVQVRDSLDERDRQLRDVPRDPSTPLSRGLEWLTGPPTGLYSAQINSNAYRNDELLELLSQFMQREMQVGPLLSALPAEKVKMLQDAAKGEDLRFGSLPLNDEWKREFARGLPDAGLLRRVERTFDSAKAVPFFTTVTFEFPGQVSLSWYLTREEKGQIARFARGEGGKDEVGARIQALIGWWKGLPRDLPASSAP